MFCCTEPKHVILKARTRQKTSRNYKRLSKLSRRNAQMVIADFKDGLRRFKKRIDPDDLWEAIRTKNPGRVMTAIPWAALSADLEGALAQLQKTYDLSHKYTFESLPAPEKASMRMDIANPNLKNYIRTRADKIVDNVSMDGRRVIDRAVSDSFSKALTPREVAQTVREHIGLNERQSVALMNYQTKLMDRIRDPYTPEKIDQLVSSYADRLLDQRAMTIAATETRTASNYAQLSVWQQAAEDKLFDIKTAKKRWIVDGNPCEICEEMDGVEVDLDDSWDVGEYGSVDVPNEVHPNCMCGMELIYEGFEGEE